MSPTTLSPSPLPTLLLLLLLSLLLPRTTSEITPLEEEAMKDICAASLSLSGAFDCAEAGVSGCEWGVGFECDVGGNLIGLDFSNHSILTIPDSVGNLVNVEMIDFSHNSIQFLPPTFGDLSNVILLDLSFNDFRVFDITFLPEGSLEVLDLSSNFMGRFEGILNANVSLGLTDIFLSDNHLYEFPQSIPSMTGLLDISLRNNLIKSVPDLTSLVNLERLDMSSNHLTSLTTALPPTLLILNLYNNALTSLDVSPTPNLLELQLGHNQFTEIPPTIAGLTYLESLIMCSNAIEAIDDDFFVDFDDLYALYLSGNKLKTIPSSIGDLPALQYLLLSNNNITSLPSSLGKGSELISLSIGVNHLTSFPVEEGDFPALQWLAINTNKISELPPAFANLTSLLVLVVADNDLGEIPASITSLPKLTTLIMPHNEIKHLPDELRDMQSLLHLDISMNQLVELTPTIDTLPNLETLLLHGNSIINITATFSPMTALESITFENSYKCFGNCTCLPPPAGPGLCVCGNGILQGQEICEAGEDSSVPLCEPETCRCERQSDFDPSHGDCGVGVLYPVPSLSLPPATEPVIIEDDTTIEGDFTPLPGTEQIIHAHLNITGSYVLSHTTILTISPPPATTTNSSISAIVVEGCVEFDGTLNIVVPKNTKKSTSVDLMEFRCRRGEFNSVHFVGDVGSNCKDYLGEVSYNSNTLTAIFVPAETCDASPLSSSSSLLLLLLLCSSLWFSWA